MYAARQLAKLGYEFRPGPSGLKSDLVLRQISDPTKGFVFKDQSNYNEVADGVVAFVQQQLTTLCDLLPYPLPTTAADANSVVYATSNFQEQLGPLLLLICGSAPGGAAGVWGRSLCINASLHEGAMFDYIFRAQTLGWAVVVANPNVNDICGKSITGSESPHRHLMTLWKSYLDTAKASKILVVAHSYGAPNLVNLLKVEASARERLAAVAFTDGGAFPPGVLLEERVPSEADVAKAAKPEQMGFLRQTLLRFEQLAPEAFRLATPEVAQCLERVGRNFRADGRAPGTPLAAWSEGVCDVSAGHTSHPATTHSATEPLFEFLQRGAEGQAAEANEELRAQLA